MCCAGRAAAYPAAVAAVVAQERDRRSRSGLETGADVMGSAALALAYHLAGDGPLAAAWTAFDGGDARPVPTRADIGRWFTAEPASGDRQGLVRLLLAEDGPRWAAGERVVCAHGQALSVAVLASNRTDRPRTVGVGDDVAVLAPGDDVLLEAPLGPSAGTVVTVVDGTRLVSPAVVRRVAGGVLVLEADAPVRWSVTDGAGRPAAPAGAFLRWDSTGRASFPARRATLTVPPGTARVVATRGPEYRPWRAEVVVEAGAEVTVRSRPERRFDPRARGWHSADLHVHANYGGERVVTPADAVLAQDAEGLDLVNLVAANQLTSHVHDLPLFRALLAAPVPERSAGIAHVGLEYRNDLYGHLHVTGARRDLGLYQRGHVHSRHPEDWPPNGDVAAAYREAGAVVGYCHPVMAVDDADPDLVTRVLEHSAARSNEARCLVPDAVLGLVDSVDVLSNGDSRAAAELYRRLLGAGLRLAVTAGSDAFLSHRHLDVLSNPPGWVRLYAALPPGAGLDLGGVQAAIRAGRTIATNGPWLGFDVDGVGPGGTRKLDARGPVRVRVEAVHDAACSVRLYAGSRLRHGWRVAAGDAASGWEADVLLDVTRGEELTVELDGEPGEVVLTDHAFAHTSPVHVVVAASAPAVDPDDVAWCRRWIDALRTLIRRHARLTPGELGEVEARLDQADRALAGTAGWSAA